MLGLTGNFIERLTSEGGPRIKAAAFGLGVVMATIWLTFSLCRNGITSNWLVAYGTYMTSIVASYILGKLAEK